MAINPWVIFIVVMILSWVVSATMKSRFKKYSKIPVDNGMSGKEIAERMLRDNGIYDVKVESVPGSLQIITILKKKPSTSARMFTDQGVLQLLRLQLMKLVMLFSMPLLMPGSGSGPKWFR